MKQILLEKEDLIDTNIKFKSICLNPNKRLTVSANKLGSIASTDIGMFAVVPK